MHIIQSDHCRTCPPVTATAALRGCPVGEDIEVPCTRSELENGEAFRGQASCGGWLGDERDSGLVLGLAEQDAAALGGGEESGIGRDTLGHAVPDTEAGAHRHPPDAGEGVTLRLGGGEDAVERGLVGHGGVQPVAEALGCVRQL